MSLFRPMSAETKFPTVVVLVVLLAATYFDWYWVWGMLYLYWGVMSLVDGQVYLVQTVRREENPYLFWSVTAMWLILAIVVIVIDLFPGTSVWLGYASG